MQESERNEFSAHRNYFHSLKYQYCFSLPIENSIWLAIGNLHF